METYSHALKHYNIDIMHVHFGVMAVEFMQVCKKMNIPLLVTFHGYDITAAIQRDPSYDKALRNLFEQMTFGIAISYEMKGRLISLGCSPEKIFVSYLGIPLDEFVFTDRMHREGPVRMLHAGRFSATKGVPDLIRAFSAEFEKEDQVELLIVGDGEEKALVLEAIEASRVKEKIKFLGKLDNEELKQWRANSDVFVLNCRTPVSGDKEGLPIALLEASATGLPIVSTKHSGIAEGVLHEQTGLLVEEYDHQALAKAMRKMMSKELRLQYGKKGRQWMEEQFDLLKCNKVMDAIYKQARTTDMLPINRKTSPAEPRVALYVYDFLPYTHGWIYRQIADPILGVKTVLCHKRSEEKVFPFFNRVVSITEGKWMGYIRGRFWFLFKNFTSTLSKKSLQGFKRELQEQNINLVHAHFGTNGVQIAPLCKELNIPLVVTFHGFDISSAPLRWPAYRKQLEDLFHQIVYAIAISEEMVDRLVAIGCPKEKIKVSYLGVPVSDFPFVDRSARNAPLVFLHAGRLTAKKGVSDLVRAFTQSFPKEGEAELLIVGDGEERQEVNDAIYVSASRNVKLLGRLSEEELMKVRNRADVFVINCRTDEAGTKEGLPISILEACCTGMPIISTKHAGIPEAVKHEQTGLLVDEKDNAALSIALKRMGDDTLRIAMGKRARTFMEEKFSLTICNQQLRKLYDSAIAN
jgi:glycosyltransferase involved in cell wall biosynthesis